MLSDLDLSFYPYLAAGAFWQGIPMQETSGTPAWQWAPALKLIHDGDLDTINQLTAAGWQRLDGEHWNSGQIDSGRYLRLVSLLADVRLLQMPGRNEYELWARTEDLQRAEALPVTLAFAWVGIPAEDFPDALLAISESGLATLQVADVLPPPQFGEIALIDDVLDGQRVWQIYTLSALGEPGLELWRRMGTALKALAAPAEWWPLTAQLVACIRGEYTQRRETLRSRMPTRRGPEREAWRARLAQLEIDRKHAEKLRTARDRAQHDPAAWLAQWQEIRGMAAELAEMYWQVHQQATAIPATVADVESSEDDTAPQSEPVPIPEEAGMLAKLVESSAASMDTPSYQEDRAVREASLAPKGEWEAEADIPRFNASNNLAVYFLDREHPLSLEDAQAQLLRITPRTVLTLRIALGLWNLRQHDAKLGRNGQALIAYNEILQWRDVPKHTRLAHPETGSEMQRTDGWRTEDREDVRRDFELASRYYLRGQHVVTYKGKARTINVDGHYVNVTFISIPTLWGDEPGGVWFGPGGWINDYEDVGNHYLAEIDRRVFQLNPHHEQHELKMALYLTELWRYQANKGQYAEPITMADLLQRSVIAIDRKHMERFAPRIKQALDNLRQRGIIGAYECLTPVDRNKARWGKAWLGVHWRILPPEALMQSYIAKGITKDVRQLPPGRKGH